MAIDTVNLNESQKQGQTGRSLNPAFRPIVEATPAGHSSISATIWNLVPMNKRLVVCSYRRREEPICFGFGLSPCMLHSANFRLDSCNVIGFGA
jgi:hypothetical protein